MYQLTIHRHISYLYNHWLNSSSTLFARHKNYLLPNGNKTTAKNWRTRQANSNYSYKYVTTSLYSNDSNNITTNVNNNSNNNDKSYGQKFSRFAKRSRIQFNGYEILYKSPKMSWLRFASRFKLFQVGFILACTFPSHYWYTHGMISKYVFWMTVGTATSTTLALFILSYFFRRIVGELWISDDGQEILLSTLTFWGNRRNR